MLKIRLRRVGKKKQPNFRVVVADARSPRDGRFVESIGHYNPRTDPPTVVIKEDRALYWLSKGAQPTSAVKRMLENMDTFEKLEQVHQGVSIEELVVPPEPEIEEPEGEEIEEAGEGEAEVEPKAEAEEVVAEAEAIVEAVTEEAEAEEPEEAEALVEEEAEETVEVAEDIATEEEKAEEETEATAEAPEATVEVEEVSAEEEVVEEAEEVSEIAEEPAVSEMSLDGLGLSTRTVNTLTDAGLETAQDLLDILTKGEAEFLSIPGVGGATLEEVEERLAEQGLLAHENKEAV